jgi:putative hemolysin
MLLEDPILSDISVRSYEVKFANSIDEVKAACKLRRKVYKHELNGGFHFEEGVDFDAFDEQFHHLIVKEKSAGNVIGTYRLQTREQAVKGKGFYSEKRFEISQYPDEILRSAVEVGRVCIDDKHRSAIVFYLLWKGLAGYLQYFNKRYLFGLSTVPSVKPEEAYSIVKYLFENNHYHPTYRVDVKPEFRFHSHMNEGMEPVHVELPELFKNYLEFGSKVCGGPALDLEIGAIYFLTLLDTESIPEQTRKMFYG